jgi:uncharacterized membrane protein YfcA
MCSTILKAYIGHVKLALNPESAAMSPYHGLIEFQLEKIDTKLNIDDSMFFITVPQLRFEVECFLMDSSYIYLLALSILFLSTFIRSSLGFGDAVLAMPLLAMVVGLQTATPVVAMCATTIGVTILILDWRKIHLKASLRLIVASALGIPIGLLLLKKAPEEILMIILGSVILIYGLYNLVKPHLPALSDKLSTALFFGFVAGLLGGAFNTNGPPVVIYGKMRRWEPANFRATLQGYFVPTSSMILIGHGLAGLWTPTVFRLYLLALPVLFLAIFLGTKVNRALPPEKFDTALNCGLVVMGISLIINSLL